jgi:hypothetical protein
MKTARATHWTGAFLVLAMAAGGSGVFAQSGPSVRSGEGVIRGTLRQEEIQRVVDDKAAYAAAIVARWEESARAAGRSNPTFPADLQASLVKLEPENLLAAGEATSFEAMMAVLATGRPEPALRGPGPHSLGDNFQDLVYTPVTPCRIVDTRIAAAGALAGGAIRTFDVDSTSLAAQGGAAPGCGIPLGVAQAVTMTITAVQPAGEGFLTAWGLGPQPTSSVLNYAANEVIATTAIVPVAPGGGDDFSLVSLAPTHVVVDVLGYFAAPLATRLDCITMISDTVAVPVNVWTPVDALCPVGRLVMGGGFDTGEDTLAYAGVYTTSSPFANGWRTWVDNQASGPRRITTFARCCRVPGR